MGFIVRGYLKQIQNRIGHLTQVKKYLDYQFFNRTQDFHLFLFEQSLNWHLFTRASEMDTVVSADAD